MEGFDRFLMIVFVGIAVIFAYRALIAWLRGPIHFLPDRSFTLNDDIPDDPVVDLLETKGYEVVSGKLKVPISFKAGDELLYSRLYIDYIAVSDGAYFIVKRARERRTLEWTGSDLRQQILSYLLLYPECAGVLYVEMDKKEITPITLEIAEEEDAQ